VTSWASEIVPTRSSTWTWSVSTRGSSTVVTCSTWSPELSAAGVSSPRASSFTLVKGTRRLSHWSTNSLKGPYMRVALSCSCPPLADLLSR